MFVSQSAGMMELVDVTDSKSVGGNIVSVRVRLPAPARRKRHIACDEFFHFIAKLIARLFCCSSLPNRTRCRWAPIWGRRFAAVLSILRSKVRVALASFYAQGKKDIILLLHDGVGYSETVKALPRIIRYYKENDYEFKTL